MKKIFSFCLIGAMALMMASCGDGNNPEPKEKFSIELNRVGDGYVYFSITPADKTIPWAYYIMPREWTKNYNTIEACVKENMANFEAWFGGDPDYPFNFETLKKDGWIRTGDYLNKKSFSISWSKDYVLVAFQLDENLNIVGDVASVNFTSLAKGFEDLGLPSGLCWRSYNETKDGHRHFTYQTGYNMSNASLPTKDQWLELINECKWSWTNEGNEGSGRGYIIVGPNNNSIFLPADGGKNKAGLAADEGTVCEYWASNTIDADKAWGTYLSTSSSSLQNPWQEVYKDCQLSVRIVRSNPNKK